MRANSRAPVIGTVHDLGALVVERVTTADHRLLFRELVGRHHYLGSAVPYGALYSARSHAAIGSSRYS